ncbi:acetate--CoA ligase family protein [Pseudonocardia spirodelae]|uniref:Acetate--CoA ligase family protein n=1 Tax=Pseudonocardia spirodelae TaxID=3133431 RepID=A0ABU8T2I2_9PSEU
MSAPTLPAGPADGTGVPPDGGRRVVVRALTGADVAAVADLYDRLDADDRHPPCGPGPARAARALVAAPSHAVGVFEAGTLLGAAHYVPLPDGRTAEFAAVGDAHDPGTAALVLGALADDAGTAGITALTGEVAADDGPTLRALRELDRPLRTRPDGAAVHVRIGTGPVSAPGGEDPHWSRVSAAAAASLLPVLAPSSVAVVGVSRRPGTVGRAVLDRIRRAGFTGALAVVNPHGSPAPDLPWAATVGGLDRVPDLAVLCVPADQVVTVAQDCGRSGVRALVVLGSGVRGPDAARLAAVAARYRMRLVGPHSLGVVDTDPAVRLDASFAATAPPGDIGVAARSGGVAVALGHELARAGLGVSSLAGTGDGLDVGADDLLAWWSHDGRTRGAVLQLGPVRRPRDFCAVARRAARTMPVVVVPSGEGPPGHGAAPRGAREALYRQAGLVTAPDVRRAVRMLATLRRGPLPAGPRVGIVTNAGGLGALAADACADAGLQVVRVDPGTRFALSELLPATAALGGPVDTTVVADARTVARVVTVVAHDPGVDAVLVTAIPTDLGDPLAQIRRATGEPVPVLVVPVAGTAGTAARAAEPVHDDVATAAATIAAAVRRRRWLEHDADPDPVVHRTDPARALAAVAGAGEGRLDPAGAARLLAAAGIPAAPVWRVRSAAEAVDRWRDAGGPVTLTADATGLLHSGGAGAVVPGVDSTEEIRAVVARLAARFGDTLHGVVVRPVPAGGEQALLGMAVDDVVGPVLTLARGGPAAGTPGTRSHLLAAVRAADLDSALEDSGLAARLDPAGRAALRDAVLRWAWLARAVPRIVEARIDPLVLRPDGRGGTEAVAVDARVRLSAPG